VKLVRVEKPIRPTPTWDELHAIVAEVRNQKFSADASDSSELIEFMGKAGVGTAECANLLGHHVYFHKGRITLYRQKTDTGYTIPLFPQVRPLLDRFRENGKIEPGKPVFRVKDPKKALDAACKRLSIQHFEPRSLRRCFITRAIELGVDFKTIASWQGHRDGGVLIAKTYSHLRNEHSDNMAKRLTA
jgi:integrase